MDITKLNKEQDKVLEYLAQTVKASTEYERAVANLQVLTEVKTKEENAKFERELKLKQQEAEEKEKLRRFNLDQTKETRRYEYEKKRFVLEENLNNAEIAVKMAEIELSKSKFEFDKMHQTKKLQAEIDEYEFKYSLEFKKLENEQEIQLKKFENDILLANATIAEAQSRIEASNSICRNVVLPLLRDVFPPLVGGAIGMATINAEEFRILTSKAPSMFKLGKGR